MTKPPTLEVGPDADTTLLDRLGLPYRTTRRLHGSTWRLQSPHGYVEGDLTAGLPEWVRRALQPKETP